MSSDSRSASAGALQPSAGERAAFEFRNAFTAQMHHDADHYNGGSFRDCSDPMCHAVAVTLAVVYLDGRNRQVCDRPSAKRPRWTGEDVSAVKLVVAALTAAERRSGAAPGNAAGGAGDGEPG